MIENRAKIEKQVYIGRQYVRAALRRNPRPESRSVLLDSTTGNPHLDPHMLLRPFSPPNTDSEKPLSVDTDAEDAFIRGSRWFFRRGHTKASLSPKSGASTPLNSSSSRDPLRIPAIRRKWTSELLSPILNAPLRLEPDRSGPSVS